MKDEIYNWYVQVCVAEECDEHVFPLTMSYIDRLLVQLSPSLKACHFQLVGAVCLFIASKLRDCSESVTLSARKLAEYSDSCFTSRQLIVRPHWLHSHYDRNTFSSVCDSCAGAMHG